MALEEWWTRKTQELLGGKVVQPLVDSGDVVVAHLEVEEDLMLRTLSST